MTDSNFETTASVVKVDESLGLVMGYAIVCQENGQDYYDLQGDNIPQTEMLKAATDFMQNSRVACEMHEGDTAGSVVFAWPMTDDIAKAFDIQTPRTGLMIAIKPDDAMMKRFQSGELTGFSIGGRWAGDG